METDNFAKAHLILYLTWLISVFGNLGSMAFAVGVRKQLTNKYRQNDICLNHAAEDFVEHPENCRLFFLCKENGQAIVGSCPPTMLFNPQSKLCDKATNVQCRTDGISSTESSTTPSASASTTISTISLPETNEFADATRYCASLLPQQDTDRLVFLNSESSCQRYYICYYGQALMKECSANLHWNSNIGKCDLPTNVGCRILQQPQQSQPNNNNNNNNGVNSENDITSDQFINCPNYGQHIFPHLGRCDFFIYCVKGHATLQQCPFYYYFDIVTKSCKWRTTAICVRDLNIDF